MGCPRNYRPNLSFHTPYLVVEAESKHNVCFLDLNRRGAGGDPSGVVASFRVQRDPRVNTELGGITKKNVSSEKKSFYTTYTRESPEV